MGQSDRKIYTRGGDKGSTALLSGERVTKDDIRVWAYGDLDELNAHLGMARSLSKTNLFQEILHTAQKNLMIAGAELALMPKEAERLSKRIRPADIQSLEKSIDDLTQIFGSPKGFILAGRSPANASLHQARTVCRRCERHVVSLTRASGAYEHILSYLNRLGDLLFVLAWGREVLDVTEQVFAELDFSETEERAS